MNWQVLKRAVESSIKANGNQEITGLLLQQVLLSIIDSIGSNATFAGIAVPSTSPGNPDGPVFYFAAQKGVYANFDGATLKPGLSVLFNNYGSWEAYQVFSIAEGLGDDENSVLSQKALTELLEKRDWIKVESEEKLEEMVAAGVLEPDRIYYVEEED